MKVIEEIEVSKLWRQNKSRPWVQHLLRQKTGRDFETIDYWMSKFREGRTTTLRVDCDYTITDGHHRLIAAFLTGKEIIEVVVCPQRSTYGV